MNRDAWKRYSSEGSWYYEVIRPGFKYNMTDIAAAIGIQQLKKLPMFQVRRGGSSGDTARLSQSLMNCSYRLKELK